MSTRLVALFALMVGLGALSALALNDVGYLGILAPHFRNWGGGQVFADLCILAFLSCIWMIDDARKRQVQAWPFIALTLVAGSFGPLLYLVLREIRASRRQAAPM